MSVAEAVIVIAAFLLSIAPLIGLVTETIGGIVSLGTSVEIGVGAEVGRGEGSGVGEIDVDVGDGAIDKETL